MKTEQKLFDLLKEKGMTLCLAESCTGGLASSQMVSLPGSSAVFVGEVCSYSNIVKKKLLGVKPYVLEKCGAVSATCAAQMARGALELLGADVAVSITGVAGPDGGTANKPVGTVYISCAIKGDRQCTWRYNFSGDRQTVREKAAEEALQMAILMLM